jgi:hypothetical protein
MKYTVLGNAIIPITNTNSNMLALTSPTMESFCDFCVYSIKDLLVAFLSVSYSCLIFEIIMKYTG